MEGFVLNGTLRHEGCNFLKKETLTQVFSCEFCEIFKNTFFYRTPPNDCFCNFRFSICLDKDFLLPKEALGPNLGPS